MARFEHIEFLYALLGIPVVVLAFLWMWNKRKAALKKFGETSLVQQLMPQATPHKQTLKLVFLLGALILLIIGWANPQWGAKREKVERKSADIFIALDISNSMLARDVAPSRLESAKLFAQRLVEKLKGERIGLILFAGNAYLQMPLTTDYAAAQVFIRSASPDMAPTQGTSFADAIELAEKSFGEDNQHQRALVIISDGENHEPDALERAQTANNNGMVIFTVGVGTKSGEFIPITVKGRQDFKRDQTGNPVRTQFDETALQELAKAGNGSYYSITADLQIISDLSEQLDRIEKREMEQRSFTEYESYFQFFLFPAFLLLLIEFIVSFRKNRWLAGKDLFGKEL